MIQWIKNFFKRFYKKVEVPVIDYIPIKPREMTNQEKIFKIASTSLGIDVSPKDLAIDSLGCAESVSNVLDMAGVGVGIFTGTWTLREALKRSYKYDQVKEPQPGDIIMSATGTGNGVIPFGHCGVVLENGIIASNNSLTGRWDDYYTLETWKGRYVDIGGYKMEFFRTRDSR